MDNQWRNGSKQYVDFTVTLTDPEGGMTLAEVEALAFDLFIAPGISTPPRDDAGWVEADVANVEEVEGSFKVSILHLYTAAETGLHGVFVKFGPTPEEPIYLAAQFVVL